LSGNGIELNGGKWDEIEGKRGREEEVIFVEEGKLLALFFWFFVDNEIIEYYICVHLHCFGRFLF